MNSSLVIWGLDNPRLSTAVLFAAWAFVVVIVAALCAWLRVWESDQ